MGNSQSTSQKIEQIIENYIDANSIATATSQCYQDVQIDLSGSTIKNCSGGIQIKQNCSAVSNASVDTVVMALQSATLDSESQQVAEGLAMQMNVSTSDNDMLSKTVNTLVANCQSNTNGVADQTHIYNMKNMFIDCSETPDAKVLDVTQYNDAEAACIVKQIVDVEHDNWAKSTNNQKNIGLKLPDFAACIGALALIMIIGFSSSSLLKGEKGESKQKKLEKT